MLDCCVNTEPGGEHVTSNDPWFLIVHLTQNKMPRKQEHHIYRNKESQQNTLSIQYLHYVHTI